MKRHSLVRWGLGFLIVYLIQLSLFAYSGRTLRKVKLANEGPTVVVRNGLGWPVIGTIPLMGLWPTVLDLISGVCRMEADYKGVRKSTSVDLFGDIDWDSLRATSKDGELLIEDSRQSYLSFPFKP